MTSTQEINKHESSINWLAAWMAQLSRVGEAADLQLPSAQDVINGSITFFLFFFLLVSFDRLQTPEA